MEIGWKTFSPNEFVNKWESVAQTVSLRRTRGRTWSHRRLIVCATVLVQFLDKLLAVEQSRLLGPRTASYSRRTCKDFWTFFASGRRVKTLASANTAILETRPRPSAKYTSTQLRLHLGIQAHCTNASLSYPRESSQNVSLIVLRCT